MHILIFPSKIGAKKVCTVHGKIRYIWIRHECRELELPLHFCFYLMGPSFIDHTMAWPMTGHKGRLGFLHNYEKSLTTSISQQNEVLVAPVTWLRFLAEHYSLEVDRHLSKTLTFLRKSNHLAAQILPTAYYFLCSVWKTLFPVLLRKWREHQGRETCNA